MIHQETLDKNLLSFQNIAWITLVIAGWNISFFANTFKWSIEIFTFAVSTLVTCIFAIHCRTFVNIFTCNTVTRISWVAFAFVTRGQVSASGLFVTVIASITAFVDILAAIVLIGGNTGVASLAATCVTWWWVEAISIGTTIIDAVIICGAFVDVYAVGVCGSDIGGNIVCDIFDETIIAVTSITSWCVDTCWGRVTWRTLLWSDLRTVDRQSDSLVRFLVLGSRVLTFI